MYYAPDGTATFVGMQRIVGADRRPQGLGRHPVDRGVRRQGSEGRLGDRRRAPASSAASAARARSRRRWDRTGRTRSTTTSDGRRPPPASTAPATSSARSRSASSTGSTETVTEAAGQPGSAAAALSALHFFIDRPSIDTLRRVLGVTSSGAVRLVDRLEELGYVRRTAGDDARTTFVVLTAGRRARPPASPRRVRDVLGDALAVLTAPERAHVRHAARKGRGRDDARARCGPLDVPVVRHRDVRALRRLAARSATRLREPLRPSLISVWTRQRAGRV